MNSLQTEPPIIGLTLNAPAELVFDAWTKPLLMHKWLFAGPQSEIINIEIDLEVNGAFSILKWQKDTNEYIEHSGKYLVIEPNKLSFTLVIPKVFDGDSIVTVGLSDEGAACELTFTHVQSGNVLMQEDWKYMLQQLKLVLENQ